MQNKYLTYPLRCYAAWSEAVDERQTCASGGFVSLLARYVIQKGGVVYGVHYDSDWQAVYTRVHCASDLSYLKGSKYTYSKIGNSFHQIKEDLQSLPLVLFVGLPCQVAALYQFLGEAPEHLLTCDLFCHGTPPASYLSEEIKYLKKRHQIASLDDVRFRGNDGHNFYLTLWHKDQLLYRKKAQAQAYFSAFLDRICLRTACQTCGYADVPRVGDFSAGDFIGLGKEIPFDGPLHNTSAVFVNREKCDEILLQLQQSFPYLQMHERSVAEAAKSVPALRPNRVAHPRSQRFHRAVKKYGWIKASRYFQAPSILKYYLKQLYIKCHHWGHLIKKQFISK